MAAKIEITKEYLIMCDIVCKYHPDYKGSRRAIKNAHHYNVERLVEETMAHVGKYKFIDSDHCDFSDGSDSKTASIRLSPTGSSGIGTIGNVISAGGISKKGALRLVIYNSITQTLMYYFLPKKMWDKLKINVHPTTNFGRIFFTFSIKEGVIKKFVGYQCKDFAALAKRKI
jgi:hypothetical protein